ncbi:DUF3939 domain-containing protein [Paenibacillus sp. FSL R7-0273]|uniref:DUF3939 domain-containing protein n=1 Tax=Paenibacillus sp. FSL R7-0273 TaxID=1536772 RepID=UPI001E532452|nr:DUF3939 domain-containing protein [Paenibacillus sp. FSL R7-0273]
MIVQQLLIKREVKAVGNNRRKGNVSSASLRLTAAVLLLCVMAGCMYPKEQQQPGNGSRESVRRVQAAVDDYRQQEGLLPILNSTADTPRYEKFVIDLEKLNRQGYLDEIPSASFEQGGNFYFLLLDEETLPVVKLMDLVTVQLVNDVQRQVNRYKSAHGGRLPAGEELYPGLYAVEDKAAGISAITLSSVYSGQPLEFMMDDSGNVFVDYASDIMTAVRNSGSTPGADADLRTMLEDVSYYVPVKSLPYLWLSGEPVPQPEDHP